MRDSRFVRYFGHQKKKGTGPLAATLSLPRNFYEYYARNNTSGDVITGFMQYDIPLVASYSRSGTNWLRYILEYISEQPTPGQVRLHYGSNYVVDRAHKAYAVMDKYQRVILILRNYRECLLRHQAELWQENPDVTSFLENETVFQRPEWYIKNIEAFDEFQGDKLCLYFEDLVAKPAALIRRLADFLNLDKMRTEDFIEHLEIRRAESVEAYQRREHEAETGGKDAFNHHTKDKLTSSQITEFNEYYFKKYPHLFQKYLKRYSISA
jgi:hypothetical protein